MLFRRPRHPVFPSAVPQQYRSCWEDASPRPRRPLRARAFAGRQWWSRSLPGHGVRRKRELNLATHVLALSAQQVLCTAPLVVALSAVLQRVTGQGVGGVLSRFFGLRGAAAQRT